MSDLPPDERVTETRPPRTFSAAIMGRAGWGFADQAMSSVTNFAISLVAARAFDAADLGAYTIVFATYLLVINAARQLALAPLVIRFSTGTVQAWRRATADVTGLSIIVGCLGGLLSLAVGFVLGGPIGSGLMALGILMPPLLLQDAWRFAFFAARRGRTAFVNDLVWAIVLVPTLTIVLLSGPASIAGLIVAWGVAGSVSAVLGIAQSGVRPRLRGAMSWVHEHGDIAPPMTLESVISMVAGQVTTYAIASVAGLATVGAIRAAQLLLGPFFMLFQGLQLIAAPEAAALLQVSPRALWRGCVVYATGLVAALVAYVVVVEAVPENVGVLLLRQSWDLGHAVLPAMAVLFAAAFIYTAPTIGLRVLAEARLVLANGLISSASGLVLGIGGAAVGGAVPSTLGSAAANYLAAIPAWFQLRRIVKTRTQQAAAAPGGALPPADAPTAPLAPTTDRPLP